MPYMRSNLFLPIRRLYFVTLVVIINTIWDKITIINFNKQFFLNIFFIFFIISLFNIQIVKKIKLLQWLLKFTITHCLIIILCCIEWRFFVAKRRNIFAFCEDIAALSRNNFKKTVFFSKKKSFFALKKTVFLKLFSKRQQRNQRRQQ